MSLICGESRSVLRSSGVGILLLLSAVAQNAAAQDASLVRLPPVESESSPAEDLCQPVIMPSLECFRRDEAASRRESNVRSRAPDHRYEGLAIGFGVGAAAGVLLGLVVCEQSEDPDLSCAGVLVKLGLGVGALGGLTGLLIGAQFPKEPEAAPADSTPPEAR